MKKHLRILPAALAAALTLSLAAPAWAAQEALPPEVVNDATGVFLVDGEPASVYPDGADPADYLTVDVSELLEGAGELTPEMVAPMLAEDEPDEGKAFTDRFVAEYTAAHPEEYAAFDADAYFAQEFDYWDKADYVEYFGLETEEDFKWDMWEGYVTSTDEYWEVWYQFQEEQDAATVEAYRSAHPGELEALDIFQLLERKGYRDPLSEYMEDNGLDTEEEARQELVLAYVKRRLAAEKRHAIAEGYRAADPEGWAAFDADAYFAQRYSWYSYYNDPKATFMSSYDLDTEQDFQDYLFIIYVEENQWSWGDDRPDTPALVVNGERLEAELTAEDGVSYTDAQTLNAILGASLTGEKVAIRDAAVAAGWDVTWNSARNEVVLLDRARLIRGVVIPDDAMEEAGEAELALVEEMNRDFAAFDAMMNQVLTQAQYDPAKAYKTTQTMNLQLTAFNSLDGDKTGKATVKTETELKGHQMKTTITISCAGLLNLLSTQTLDQIKAGLPKAAKLDLNTLLGGIRITLLCDEDAAYFNAPILAMLDSSISENTWFELDMDTGALWQTMDTLATGEWDTGKMLYDYLLTRSAEDYWGAEDAYTDFVQARMAAGILTGPAFLTEKNGGYTWKMDAQTINSALTSIQMLTGDSVTAMGDYFKELELAFTVDRSGRQSASMVIRPDMDALAAQVTEGSYYYDSNPALTALVTWALNLFDFRMESKASGTAQQATSTTQFHWKNQFKLDATETTRRVEIQTGPVVTLPAGAQIR